MLVWLLEMAVNQLLEMVTNAVAKLINGVRQRGILTAEQRKQQQLASCNIKRANKSCIHSHRSLTSSSFFPLCTLNHINAFSYCLLCVTRMHRSPLTFTYYLFILKGSIHSSHFSFSTSLSLIYAHHFFVYLHFQGSYCTFFLSLSNTK